MKFVVSIARYHHCNVSEPCFDKWFCFSTVCAQSSFLLEKAALCRILCSTLTKIKIKNILKISKIAFDTLQYIHLGMSMSIFITICQWNFEISMSPWSNKFRGFIGFHGNGDTKLKSPTSFGIQGYRHVSTYTSFTSCVQNKAKFTKRQGWWDWCQAFLRLQLSFRSTNWQDSAWKFACYLLNHMQTHPTKQNKHF